MLKGVTKTILTPGNGRDNPKKGDTVIIEYRGCLYDESRAENYYMGTQYVPALPCLHYTNTSESAKYDGY
jgi:hypothetical protein